MTCLRPHCTRAWRVHIQASVSQVLRLFAYSSEYGRGRGPGVFSNVSFQSRVAPSGSTADINRGQLGFRRWACPLTTVLHLTGPTGVGNVACSPDGLCPACLCPSSILALSTDGCWLCWVPVVTPSRLPFPVQAACLSEMTARPLPMQVGCWSLCLRVTSVQPHCLPGLPGARSITSIAEPPRPGQPGGRQGLSILLARH